MAVRKLRITNAVIIVGAVSTINAVYAGFHFGTGLFFYHFMHTFQSSESATALVVSLMACNYYISGVVSGPLIMKCGTRVVAVIGALVGSLSLLLSSFAPTISMLYATYGLTGFSWGFLLASGTVSIQQHVKGWHALAASVAFTCSSIGGLLYTVIFRWCESTYGWRGALLITAGLHLHCLPAAMLLRPLSSAQLQERIAGDNNIDSVKHVEQKCDESQAETQIIKSESEALTTTATDDKIDHKSTTCISYVPSTGHRGIKKGKCSTVRKLATDTKRTLHSGGVASIACIMVFYFRYTGLVGLYSFLAMRVALSGHSPSNGSYIMFIMSIGELVGRIGVSATVWLHPNLPLIYFLVTSLVWGVLEASVGYLPTLMSLSVVASVMGVAVGANTCVATTTVRNIVGIKNFPWVLGLAYAIAGFGGLVNIQIFAWIWQQTGNISILFLLAGISTICSGSCYIVYLCCCRPRRATKK